MSTSHHGELWFRFSNSLVIGSIDARVLQVNKMQNTRILLSTLCALFICKQEIYPSQLSFPILLRTEDAIRKNWEELEDIGQQFVVSWVLSDLLNGPFLHTSFEEWSSHCSFFAGIVSIFPLSCVWFSTLCSVRDAKVIVGLVISEFLSS